MNAITTDAMNWIVRLAGLVLALSLGVTWLRQQLALAAGAPRALSQLWLRLAGIVIGFVIVAAAPQIASLLRTFAQGGADSLRASLPTLAKTIVDGLIFVGGLVLALGIAGHWLSVQISIATGSPSGLSQTWIRLFSIIAAFIAMLATIPVANSLIEWFTR